MIAEIAVLVGTRLKAGNKLVLFGNGGSAADAQHIAAEFVARYVAEREAVPAIALTIDTSALTAIGNDWDLGLATLGFIGLDGGRNAKSGGRMFVCPLDCHAPNPRGLYSRGSHSRRNRRERFAV